MTRIPPLVHYGRLIAAAALALTFTIATTATVAAHAELLETTPEDGATVEGTPTEIVAVFSEALEEDGSSLSLRDAAGDEVASGGLDPDDAARLVIAEVPGLVPGEYEVRWTSATDDGHVERDTWTFTVSAAATPTPTATPTVAPSATATAVPSAPPSAAPTDAPSAAPTAAPSPTPDGGEDPAASTGEVLLPIAAGLAIVAVVGGVLLSRRRAA